MFKSPFTVLAEALSRGECLHETSPPKSAVTSKQGKLVCSLPGRAASVHGDGGPPRLAGQAGGRLVALGGVAGRCCD